MTNLSSPTPVFKIWKNTHQHIYTLSYFAVVCNYLHLTDNTIYCPFGFEDSFDRTDEMKKGEWSALGVDN